jgi:hypothetical protein
MDAEHPREALPPFFVSFVSFVSRRAFALAHLR